jgi:hypothetical protein
MLLPQLLLNGNFRAKEVAIHTKVGALRGVNTI